MVTVERLMASPRLLVLLPQLPHDPASGAARTVTTIGELLAGAGFEVESIATRASEGRLVPGPPEWAEWDDLGAVRSGDTVDFRLRGVRHTVLETGDAAVTGWEARWADAYDALVEERLARFRPGLVLTYGGSPRELARQRRVRAAGAKLVFALYNTGYRQRGFFDHVDLVITPSEFLSGYYRDAIGLTSTPLPTPLWPEDVVAQGREPRRLTMVNPQLAKGLVLFASLASALGRSAPEIPIDVFPSRDGARFLFQAALAAGLDLRAHPNLVVHPTVQSPREIYREARAVLVPSLVEDAAPRVAAEALVNGVPPIGSDRGGIPELCAEGGFVVPVPRTLEPRSLRAVPAEVLRPWIDVVTLLFRRDEVWRATSERARRAGQPFLPPSVTRRYCGCFERLLEGRRGAPR